MLNIVCVHSKPKEGRLEHNHEDCYLLAVNSFELLDGEIPKIDRVSLGWNESIVGKEILFLYGKRGMVAWESGTISSYDPAKLMHSVEPDDGTSTIKQNLLACKPTVFKEWRFVLEGEDIESACDALNVLH
jgi:hypothetical protein